MIVVTVVLLILFISLLWILFIPVEIKVDTAQNLYEIVQRGTIKMSIHPDQTRLVKIKVLGIPINVSGKERISATKTETTRRAKRKLKKSLAAWRHLFNGIAKAVRCRRFILDVDLNDVVLGSQLFPLVAIFNNKSVHMTVNFQKRYYLNLWVQIHMNQIFWALFRFFLTKK